MLQAALFECLSLDPFSLQQDGRAAPEVDISRREVTENFVVAAVIVVADEVVNLSLVLRQPAMRRARPIDS